MIFDTSPAGAEPREGSLWQSRRLWSLWDMLRFCAEPFYKVIAALHQTRGMVDNWPKDRQEEAFDKGGRERWSKQIHILQESLKILDARLTLTLVNELIVHLEDQQRAITYRQLSSYYEKIDEFFKRELSEVMLLIVDRRRQDYYEPKEPLFGRKFQDGFSSASDEVLEAAKCLALGRSTASAFHSIRCLEAGIRALSRCLGIPDPTKASERSWVKLLDAFNGALNTKWPGSSNRLTGDGEVFETIYAALAAMQNPYRNATMHLDHKYTDEEACHIFEMVKGLMKKIADRCDEDGNPEA
jgi:hypothetical protein